MKPILEIKQVGNNEVITFNPSNKMRLFAFTFYADPAVKGQDMEKVAKYLEYRKDIYTVWKREFGDTFEEWFDNAGAIFRKEVNKKNLLEFIGMQKALEGDFNFWKQLSIREKVISPDQITHNILPIHLGSYDNISDAEIESLSNSLLDSLQPVVDQGEPLLVTGDSDRRPEDNQGGASEVLSESLVFP